MIWYPCRIDIKMVVELGMFGVRWLYYLSLCSWFVRFGMVMVKCFDTYWVVVR